MREDQSHLSNFVCQLLLVIPQDESAVQVVQCYSCRMIVAPKTALTPRANRRFNPYLLLWSPISVHEKIDQPKCIIRCSSRVVIIIIIIVMPPSTTELACEQRFLAVCSGRKLNADQHSVKIEDASRRWAANCWQISQEAKFLARRLVIMRVSFWLTRDRAFHAASNGDLPSSSAFYHSPQAMFEMVQHT